MPLKVVRLALPGTLASALALSMGLAPQASRAMGLGQPQVLSALGRPLDIGIPLNLAEGEQLADNCLRTEVMAGDARVPAGLLQLRVEGASGQQRLRLQSAVPINEPVLRVTLSLGCPSRLTREFNALIDPPAAMAPLPTLATAPPEPAVSSAPAPAATPAPAAQPPARRPESRPAAARRPVHHKPKPAPVASGPRLVLERPEVLMAASPAPAASAASAPDAAASQPDVEETIRRLEKTVADLQAQLQARRQAQPAPAPMPLRPQYISPYRDPMTWLLTLGLSLLAGSAAFFGSRWLDLRSRRVEPWRPTAAPIGGASTPLAATPGLAPLASSSAAAAHDGAAPVATFRPAPWALEPQVNFLATQPVNLKSVPLAEASPAQTEAEALLDLQQQVDFLLLLGQREAASDLVCSHLAASQAAGPMAWLMLMDLHRQHGDSEAQQELADRFEQRFGWPAPHDTTTGQGLDGGGQALGALEANWTDPAKTLPLLQELLASGRAPDGAAFGLPALHDLLTLYGVVRDVQEAGRGLPTGRGGVDLMLP